ncbi:MAG TPA: hypothetical protein VGJ00_03960 [Rhabdochlamydiaceae bacterium]|jgi:hypothetical protein
MKLTTLDANTQTKPVKADPNTEMNKPQVMVEYQDETDLNGQPLPTPAQ